jgi:hypothetical protein
MTGEFWTVLQRDGRPTSILSRHRSHHRSITDEGKDFRIDYTRLQSGGTEEKRSSGDYVEGYMNRLVVGSAVIGKLLANAYVLLFGQPNYP